MADFLVYKIAALAVLIALSGFFSGLEVAMVSTRKSKVSQLARSKVKGANTLLKLKSNPGRMLAAINLGNNLVNVGASALATEVALGLFGSQGLAIAVGLMTFLILVFGEITPKTYCNANATKVSLRCSGILLAFCYAFYPFVILFELITRGMLKLVGSSLHPPAITEEEIHGIIDQGLEDKALEKQERQLVQGALRFDDTIIRTVMTPRTRMFSLPAKMLLIDALPLIRQSGFSRVPIYGNTQDDIVGVVHVRDLLSHLEKEEKFVALDSVSRKPIFVSKERRISDLLKEMQGRQTHLAIVVDEFGGVEGLVTLEDLLEEIVGEIMDETDKVNLTFKILDKNTIMASGDMEIDVLNEIMKSNIPMGDDYSTLNGLLHEKLRDIPQVGDKLELDSIKMVVEDVSKNQASRIRIERVLQEQQE